MTNTTSLLLILSNLVVGVTCSAADQTVHSNELGATVKVIGALGKPLGALVLIEGEGGPVDAHRGPQSTVSALRVIKVNDVQLNEPFIIPLIIPAFVKIDPPKAGERKTFRGYESGAFIGSPSEVGKELETPDPDGEWRFQTVFRVVK